MRNGPLYVTQFFLTSALGVVFVFLEDVQRLFDLADWEIGTIAGAGFGTALFSQLVLSPFADRGGMRALALIALFTGIVGPIGFAFGESVAVLAISRGLTGVGMGLFSLIARKALLGRNADGGGAKLGRLLSASVAGFIFGPLIGAAFEPLGFEAPFLFVSAAIAIAGIPATRALVTAEIAATPTGHGELGNLLRRPRIQAAIAVQLIVYGYIGVFDAVIDRFLTDLGASTTLVAVAIFCVGAPMLVLPTFAGRLAERLGGATVMLPALLLLVPVMAGYGFAGSVVAATLVGVLHGSGESFASIASQVLVVEVTGAERAAVGTALLDAAGLTIAAIAAFAAPVVYGADPDALFFGTAGIGVVLGAAAAIRAQQGVELD